jgi:hypothetical protein
VFVGLAHHLREGTRDGAQGHLHDRYLRHAGREIPVGGRHLELGLGEGPQDVHDGLGGRRVQLHDRLAHRRSPSRGGLVRLQLDGLGLPLDRRGVAIGQGGRDRRGPIDPDLGFRPSVADPARTRGPRHVRTRHRQILKG